MSNLNTHVTKLTLSQTKVADIRRRIEQELTPAICSVEAELAQIEATTADWRSTTASVATVERMADDQRRLTNRLAILTESHARALAELRVEEAQVEVDALQQLRAELQRIGDARTNRARDIVSTAEMLAAMINEVEDMRAQMLTLANSARRFFVSRPGIPADSAEAMRRSSAYAGFLRLLRSTEVQAAVEHVIGTRTPPHVWEYEYRNEGGRASDAVVNVGGQCRGSLITLDECMRQIVEDAKVSTP
jgi:hypothetical protein